MSLHQLEKNLKQKNAFDDTTKKIKIKPIDIGEKNQPKVIKSLHYEKKKSTGYKPHNTNTLNLTEIGINLKSTQRLNRQMYVSMQCSVFYS